MKRIVVSFYKALPVPVRKQLTSCFGERAKAERYECGIPDGLQISDRRNVIPQIDVFLDNGYTKKRNEMVNEAKIIRDEIAIRVTATTVRIYLLLAATAKMKY